MLYSVPISYSFTTPDTTDYSSETIEAMQWITTHAPPKSFILNDGKGQWLPLIGDVKISYPFFQLETYSTNLTLRIFLELFNNININQSIDLASIFKDESVKQLDFIFISTQIFADLEWFFGTKFDFNSGLIWQLDIYDNINSVFKNREIAIYEIV